ncbi:MAG: thioredoxin-dependent thiol peroxidase [Syntrophobacterales bacterium]|nr:thioredoxin-dependent thiol peroxidase [Syntrophobacterales bacterium]
MTRLQPGDLAPPFELPDQDGRPVSLMDFRGRKLLLYFYPKADTPGCTTQACTIRDARSELESLGVAALGISPDPPAAQKKFDAKYALGFPLLSDADHRVAQAYGVWGEKKIYGRTTQGIIRSAFLIDEEGRISQAWYQVKPADTVALATRALAAT